MLELAKDREENFSPQPPIGGQAGPLGRRPPPVGALEFGQVPTAGVSNLKQEGLLCSWWTFDGEIESETYRNECDWFYPVAMCYDSLWFGASPG